MKTEKKCSQKLLMISPNFLLHKNVYLGNFYMMTLVQLATKLSKSHQKNGQKTVQNNIKVIGWCQIYFTNFFSLEAHSLFVNYTDVDSKNPLWPPWGHRSLNMFPGKDWSQQMILSMELQNLSEVSTKGITVVKGLAPMCPLSFWQSIWGTQDAIH